MNPFRLRELHRPRLSRLGTLAMVGAVLAGCADGPRMPFTAEVPESAHPAPTADARPRLVPPHEGQQRASRERQRELERELGALRDGHIDDIQQEIEVGAGDS